MRDFQTSRRSTVVTILTSSGSAFFWGVSVAVVLKADVPRRVLALYRSQVGTPGQHAGAGGQTGVGAAHGARASGAQATDASTGTAGSAQDVAGTGVLDAQGLILMEQEGEADHDDRGTAGVGVAGTGPDMPATVDAARESPGLANRVLDALNLNAGEASTGVADAGSAESGPSASVGDDVGHSDPGSAPGSADTGPMPGIVAEDQDAVRGDGTTQCPDGFPIKGNGRSRLYHVPEGSSYARTKPEVCFRTPEAAERAGFRRAKG